MANRLENRVGKLESSNTVGDTHLVLPSGWWYGEEGCEPYETAKPVQYESLDDWYADVE